MAANLPYEFSKFSRNCKHLRRLLKDTKRSFEEITRSGYFTNPEQQSSVQLKPSSEQFIRDVIDRPIGLIVLGQSCWAKACVVNELFGQPLLPATEVEGAAITWRMVRFTYGTQTQISLALPDSFELVKQLAAYEQPWHTVPRADLELKEEEKRDPALGDAVLEIRLRHPLLKDDVQVVVAPSTFEGPSHKGHPVPFSDIYHTSTHGVTPILLYAIGDETFSEKETADLMELKTLAQNYPVFFIRARLPVSCELTESEQHARCSSNVNNFQINSNNNNNNRFWPRSYQTTSPLQQMAASVLRQTKRRESLGSPSPPPQTPLTVFQQLCGLGFLSLLPLESKRHRARRRSGPFEVDCELVENFDNFPSILLFVRHILQSLLVNSATLLNEAHNLCLRTFILTAFDMTWDMLITPRRLDYARQRECQLYESLLEIANHKQEEIRCLIVDTINGMREELLQRAAHHEFQGVQLALNGEVETSAQLQICTSEIQDLILGTLNSAVATKLIGSVEYLRESFVGTLERCLTSLEQSCQENGESLRASNALKQILNAAYQVEVTVKTSSSLLRVLWEKMKQLVAGMPWKTPPRADEEWKMKVASEMLQGLSEWRLAKSICSQFREHLKASHDHFSSSIRQLEALHSGRLERTEEQRIKVRKYHAPRIARFALESTSLRDLILFGMPQLGREIGRGQYGVVYSCDSWAGQSPCAIKSVVPPDDKHWNDLAMEFYYTRCIPEHDKVVQIQGSVIDHSYGGGSTPAVLLVMDRLQRDLYSAIKAGLDWFTRLQVALDVVQGIRFLHSQGLVHRDIKLKNVLLDKKNRARITDLGFCKPEAMMSGSIVGTPIHMAPELFSGRYDNSVDVYAFGILFWYICAGHVKLPYVFEQCQNKDQLWNCVRKGARPERLSHFDEPCWRLMEECWHGEPNRRPLLGDVEPRLLALKEHYIQNPSSASGYQGRATASRQRATKYDATRNAAHAGKPRTGC